MHNYENKPVVANIHATFFEKSETFIYNNLTNLKNFRPVCLALNYVNLDQFPFPREDLFFFNKRRALDWRIGRRMKRDSEAAEIIKNLRAKLIHAHFGHIGFHSLNLKRKLGIPFVTTFYDFDASKLPKKNKWKKNYKILFNEGDLFLVEGNNMRSRLIELGCPEGKIQIQRIAIPLEKISFISRKQKKREKVNFIIERENHGRKSMDETEIRCRRRPKENCGRESVVFIFSGRFVEKKGLIYALQAIDKIKHQFRNFEFRIIGDGPLKKEMEKFVFHHNLNGLVKMLGFLTYDNYLNEMSKADIFIHPSITASDGDSEGGAPTTILEAQAMGMPVISTYHADIPNIVIPGKSALLSREKDVDSLANNITFLLENPQMWEGMGQTGRKFIETFHDVRVEINKLEDKYESLLAGLL